MLLSNMYQNFVLFLGTELYVPGGMWVRRGKPITVPVVSKKFIFEAKGCDDVWVFPFKDER